MDATINGLLETALNGMISQGNAMGGTLVTTGVEIFGGLVFLKLVRMWLEYLLESSTFYDLGRHAIWTTIRIGFISYMLATYTTMAGITGLFMNGPDYLVQKITGESSVNVFTSGVNQFNTIINTMDDAVIKTHGSASAQNAPDSGALQQAWNAVKTAALDTLQFFSQLIDAGIGIFSKLALAAALLVYIAIYAIGTLMLYCGIALGPFMIPWKVHTETEFLFDGWMRFTIGAGLYKVVCAIAIKLVGGSITALVTAVTNLNTSGQTALGYDITASIIVFVLCGFLIFVLWEVPKIASGLVSGNASASISIRTIR
ncbi:type IV secretion system protein (plasmid) [Burkholderia cenocepacia]|uniref:type IV secretion system protein n=3 Tax=Burkholderia cenocepacia TaxID=95486 RepID=UPI00209FEB6D|nr:type IV secretion system protein [Burkholderia cenocepacia]MCO8402812.1 type IV secretion system protein [Burkholderia cenocepacia]MCO8415051.1 type IV secretion system protein [Burkholderia cenocepacia]MCO8423053.1 type IV secretion system protein [Burkholderia cenocepacia]MCO8474798.1 type IV secretion system protein [Burkholderia cenocepacia]MCO8482022.1 type IV secretion system protein [Burkholderia cenocepacia]